MENDAEGVAPTTANFAYPVPEGDPVGAAGALHRTLVDGEGHGVSLRERDYVRA